MAIKPYLIEVIGIDLWHAVEFSRYGCALNKTFSCLDEGSLLTHI